MRLEYSGSTAETAHAIGFLHPDGGDGWGMAHAAAQLAANQGLLRRYETEVGRMKAASNPSRPKSKKAIYELLANEGYGASGDAVKQKILRLTKPK
jgi:hypothetical protein